MSKNSFEKRRPDNIDEYIELAEDISDYRKRLESIKHLSKYKCYESKKVLYKLMKQDKIFDVKEQAFRALQNFGEDVKLPKKKKGKPIKTINIKLLVLHNSFNGDQYSITDFKIKFKEKYPAVYDIYQYEKRSKFDSFIENSIKTFAKNKTHHNYSVQILFKQPCQSISNETIDLEYKNSKGLKDELIVDKQQIIINCYRSSKINLNNIVFSEANSIHNQIIKALIYFYIQANKFSEIEKIIIVRKNKSNEEVKYQLPSKNIDLEQILNNNYQGVNIDHNLIKKLFDKDDKSKALKYALTYLLKSLIDKEPSARFEKLWKSFNSIYRYIGSGRNENECHRILRTYILNNNSNFEKTTELVKNLTIEQLRQRIRVAELIQNDYDSSNKIVSFIAFVYRYSDNMISQLLLENLDYQKDNLESILSIQKIESKFNKFESIKSIFHNNKNSTDTRIFYKTVKSYLENNISNPVESSKIEIVIFTCIKYSYFVRNKLFHAEKQDLTFRFASNSLINELDWINEVLQSLIIDLINNNGNWETTSP